LSRVIIASLLIIVIAVLMSMTGRGGGNFYVPVLIGSGMKMHHAAATAQFILVACSIAALVIFQKNKIVDWKLALVIDPPTDIMAFVGGYYSYLFNSKSLKLVFAGLLVLASFFMLFPVKEKKGKDEKRFGFWKRKFGKYEYTVNLWLVIPITAATGLVAGMVGISGGSFKIPLMVIACGVPMRVAVGTSSAMVAATALMGLIGHSLHGDFSLSQSLPLAFAAVVGGIIGGQFSLKIDPQKLKKIFAYTNLAAAIFMVLNAFISPPV